MQEYQFTNKIKLDKKPNVIGEDVHCVEDADIDISKIENKLIKARTQLILDKPFLGNLVLYLPLIAADSWCKTTATDAKNFYYNPKFIQTLDNMQTKFVLIHEALHCALNHFIRRGNRKKHIWDLACDFAINPLIIEEGFYPPIKIMIFQQYEGQTAEEIYPLIDDNIDAEPMDQHLYDEDANDNNPNSNNSNEINNKDKSKQQSNANLASKPAKLTPDEIQELSVKWQKYLSSSAQIAKQNGKLSNNMAKLVDFYLQPQISWQSLLTNYLTNFARDDFSYQRPKNRNNAIMATLRSASINIIVAIDTSGSITQIEVDEFISEISSIKSIISANITLLACDDKLNPDCPWTFSAWEQLIFPANLGGGGGTNFTPVFEYVNKLDMIPNTLLYFTDAKGVFPDYEPNYPVLWLVKGSNKTPWGLRVQL